MTTARRSAELADLRMRASAHDADFVRDLQTLVAIDSGTYTKDGVDRVSGWMMRRLRALGAAVTVHSHPELGDTRVATFERPQPGPTVLLLGHADTVFEPGTASERPFRIERDRAYGPGVADMKSGLLVGLNALSILRARADDEHDWIPAGRIVFVVNSDEEIGSPTSAPIIEALAQDADVALVLEGARPDGAMVTSRAGMQHLRVTIRGRAAHAGVEPDKGRSAVLEAAHLTLALSALADRREGLSINVGGLHGGTRPNIVPEGATMVLDVRAVSAIEQDAAEADIRQLAVTPTVAGTTSLVEVLARSRPMERTAATAGLAALAVDIAADLGFELSETSSRGASDGNTTAGAGVPTLDGLGAVGGGRHSPDEYLELGSVATRTAWLAAMLVEIGSPGRLVRSGQAC